MSSISDAMASVVNLPTLGIDMRICAYSLSLTMSFILKSALLMRSSRELMPFRYSSILQFFKPCGALLNAGVNVRPGILIDSWSNMPWIMFFILVLFCTILVRKRMASFSSTVFGGETYDSWMYPPLSRSASACASNRSVFFLDFAMRRVRYGFDRITSRPKFPASFRYTPYHTDDDPNTYLAFFGNAENSCSTILKSFSILLFIKRFPS